MNREILFRAKAINRDPDREYRTNYKNGDWVYGLVTTMYDDIFPNLPAEMKNTDGVSGIDVDHRTIGEYTGLTDKNGTKIFDGDIVKTDQYQRLIGADTFTIEFVEGNYYLCHKRCTVWTLRSFIEEIEVVGNKYDNLELIEK